MNSIAMHTDMRAENVMFIMILINVKSKANRAFITDAMKSNIIIF